MKKVLDWCGNIGLVLIALLNFVLAWFAKNVATLAVYTLTGLAFAVAAYVIIRYTVQSSNKTDEK
jgi:uncharacterized membrane-anchored protein